MTRLIVATLLALALMQTAAVAAPKSAPDSTFGSGSAATSFDHEPRSAGVIVRFKQPSAAPLAAQLLSAVSGTTATATDRTRGLFSFRTPDTEDAELYAVKLMLAAPGIDYAEPNYVRHVATYTAPTDPDFVDDSTWMTNSVDEYPNGMHWWLDALKAPAAWALGQGDTYPVHGATNDVKIAVIDTGIYLDHPDLGNVISGKDYLTWYNPNTDAVGPYDTGITPDANTDLSEASHGTAVAAAAGAAVNGVGMVGSGWTPTIVGYKVAGPITAAWDGDPAGTVVILDSQVALAIRDAVDSGCKVINLSLSAPVYSNTVQVEVNYAHSHGAVVVAAVGNDGDATVNYPAAGQYVVGVGATALSGPSSIPTLADFSDFAPNVVDIVAPGELIWSAAKPDWTDASQPGVAVPGYKFWWGTSLASPVAAGAIAYLWRAMPNLTNDEIVARVESSTVDMGVPGRDDRFGFGLVNMQATYNKLVSDYPMLASPSVTAAPYLRNGQSVSWSASSGFGVNYRVSVDGTLRTTQAGTTYALPALADGTHTVSVVPTSARNWNTTTAPGAASFVVDSVAPAVSGFGLTGETLSWSVAEANPHTVQAYVDSSTPATVATNALDVSSVATGLHTLHVNATDSAGNSSGWVTWEFRLGPVAPLLPSIVVTDAVSTTVSWSAVGRAASYDYVIGAGGTSNTTATAVQLDSLAEGVTQVQVRTVPSTGSPSDWATATVTNVAVVPASPVISAESVVGTPSIAASWAPARDARSYEYRVDGGSAVTTTGTAIAVAVAEVGPHVLEVRSLNNWRQSAWVTATITYDPRRVTSLVLGASATRLAYPATTLTLTGSVSAPGATLRLQSSADGVTWADAGTLVASAASPGVASTTLRQTRSLKYRLVFDGDATWNEDTYRPATSAAITVAYAPRLTTPSCPSRVKRKRRFTVTAYVSAPVPNRSAVVTYSFQRYQKVSGRYKYVTRKSVRLKGSVYTSSTLRYRITTSLPYSGKWRVVASYSGAPMHANLTSGYRYFTVK
jgi:hypothetical protein